MCRPTLQNDAEPTGSIGKVLPIAFERGNALLLSKGGPHERKQDPGPIPT